MDNKKNKKILNIPKIKQIENNYSGIAGLCMIASFFGKQKSQEEVLQYFADPHEVKINGIFGFELKEAFQKIGLRTEYFGDINLYDLKYSIDIDSPVIAECFDYKGSGRRRFYVIKGYNIKKQKVFVNDPEDLKINELDYNLFEKIYKKHCFEISKPKPKSKKPDLLNLEEFF